MFQEVFGSVLVGSLAALAIAGLLILAGAKLIPKLRDEKQGYPAEEQIESLVLPYASRAVMLAYEMAERAFQETDTLMSGVDKKAIADEVYRYLPDQVKNLVTQEVWSDTVQDAYDGARNLSLQFWQGFEKTFETWKSENVQ